MKTKTLKKDSKEQNNNKLDAVCVFITSLSSKVVLTNEHMKNIKESYLDIYKNSKFKKDKMNTGTDLSLFLKLFSAVPEECSSGEMYICSNKEGEAILNKRYLLKDNNNIVHLEKDINAPLIRIYSGKITLFTTIIKIDSKDINTKQKILQLYGEEDRRKNDTYETIKCILI